MIQCPLCGYQNRDGSKFCGNCGARLTQSSGLTCPMCGEPNKLESVFCSKCGARLVPLIVAPPDESPTTAQPIKGLSLPAKPPAETPVETKPPVETPPSEAAPTSGWLDQLRSLQAEEEAPAEPPIEEETQVPEWLGARAATSAEEQAPRAAEAEEDIPDWLRTPAPAEPQAEAPATPSETASREDWLHRLREATTAVEEVPDWLKPTAAETAAIEEPAPSEPSALPRVQVPPVPVETAVPEWLKEAAPELPAEQPAPVEEEKPGETLIESLVAAAPPATPVTPSWLTEEPAVTEDEDVPDWLRTPIPVEPSTPPAAEPAAPAIEPAAPGEVPAWLTALKPGTVESPFAELEKEPIEASGPLFGLAGVLPLAAAIAEPHAAPKPPASRPAEGARAFEAILAASAPAPAAPAVRPRRAWTMRPLIYLLLALAVVMPFFVPFDLFGLSVPITGGVAAEEFVRVIDALPANSTVLLSFDYDPGLAGEMDLQATAIVRHLIRRPVKIVAVSTLETGPQMARRVLEPAARAAGNYDYGAQYVILGYLPGNEAALSKLAAEGFAPDTRESVYYAAFNTTPVGANVKTLRDIALVVEFAGSDAALRMWMEQVQPRSNTRIVAGVSAAVEPNARAYRSAGQLTALIGGLLGAAQYEILSQQPQPGLAVISVNAQTAAQLTLVVVVILGNIVYWVRRPRRVKDKGV